MGQRSLDEFESSDDESAVESSPRSVREGDSEAPVERDGDSEASDPGDRPTDEPADRVADGRGDAPEPPAVTAAWGGDGTCSACGEPAPRRFLEDGAFVCAECKDW